MKTQVNKWFRWGAAGAFGLMLTLNVMVGLDFEKDKVLPSLTLVELGNQANAQSESGGSNACWECIKTKNGSKVMYCGTCDWVDNSTDCVFTSESTC